MIVTEVFKESRSLSISDREYDQEYVWVVCFTPQEIQQAGTIDDAYLIAYIFSFFPSLKIMPSPSGPVLLSARRVNADQIGDYKWKVKITYGVPSPDNPSGDPSDEFVQLNVNTLGITQTIRRSLGVVNASFDSDRISGAPNLGGAIGYTANGIQGVDVEERGLDFSITAYFPPVLWQFSYINLLYTLTKTMNGNPFYGFAPGEILFRGASASGDFFNRVPVQFNFLASPNANGISDPPFADLFALGHDVVDYLFSASFQFDAAIDIPIARYVHRVYGISNFALLGIGF